MGRDTPAMAKGKHRAEASRLSRGERKIKPVLFRNRFRPTFPPPPSPRPFPEQEEGGEKRTWISVPDAARPVPAGSVAADGTSYGSGLRQSVGDTKR